MRHCVASCRFQFQTHYIKDQSYEAFLPFAFCDIMGLEAGHREGVETEDLVKVLKGHIRDGYTVKTNTIVCKAVSSFLK